MASTSAPISTSTNTSANQNPKLHGRAFYESLGSPRFIVAPMVDQSEFAWRRLTRSFLTPQENAKLLAYTPMFHARLFEETPKYRDSHFQATRNPIETADVDPANLFLDGNPQFDRPLFVQFCANDPDHLLHAAQIVAPYCDAVDLNLGCPQGIARKGHYGSFLQEDQALIYKLINVLHKNLPIPVTAKIRILDTKEATLAYAKNVLSAGASILTVHGRRREQKGHLTGVADWGYIRYLRDNLPEDTVIFANGNILQHGDIQKCLEATGADAVMSAEGNLSDPSIFAAPPTPEREGREYWRGRDGRGGYRVDAVFRRYMDILHRDVLEQVPPKRRPLFVVGDDEAWLHNTLARDGDHEDGPARKKLKQDSAGKRSTSPNIVGVRPHLFHLLRHFISKHTDIRDTLARTTPSDIIGIEKVLDMVERRVAQGLLDYEKTDGRSIQEEQVTEPVKESEENDLDPENDPESSVATVKACKRPWWVVQPIVRPLPKEALAKGSIKISKKDKKKRQQEQTVATAATAPVENINSNGSARSGNESRSNGQTQKSEDEPPRPDREGGGVKEPTVNPATPELATDNIVSG
ncbi:putative tRNA-dihydrouridine synthase 1 [Rosellinia necatrix]|uniref:tRNA-dihydrouridine(16/17) synthase [NAD(P)(+)] n=1 Tax=Rosellinia necatrix TaxID=77044 RepID=A0A1W2TEK4_ROSNE|nr:putative tRNA-dihydrouridine synthase 1 [Rosellinia necatrix]